MTTPKPAKGPVGGRRAGAGRPPLGDARLTPVTLSFSQDDRVWLSRHFPAHSLAASLRRLFATVRQWTRD